MLIQELFRDPQFYFAWLIVIVVSICLHELAHGAVAMALGDDTPIRRGRMTLNPMVHMGPVSLACLALAGIAWGLMPIDPRRLRGRHGRALVAAAGPATNALLALAGIVALGLWQRFDPRPTRELGQLAANGQYLLWIFGYANVTLALFNLIPFPPLDGSAILRDFSASFDRLVGGISGPSAAGAMPITLVLFVVAGVAIWPLGRSIAEHLLIAVRGG